MHLSVKMDSVLAMFFICLSPALGSVQFCCNLLPNCFGFEGPPGVGKSTTGKMMAKEAGYVYFEADCAICCLNPFVPLDAENATAFQQKPLKVGQLLKLVVPSETGYL